MGLGLVSADRRAILHVLAQDATVKESLVVDGATHTVVHGPPSSDRQRIRFIVIASSRSGQRPPTLRITAIGLGRPASRAWRRCPTNGCHRYSTVTKLKRYAA